MTRRIFSLMDNTVVDIDQIEIVTNLQEEPSYNKESTFWFTIMMKSGAHYRIGNKKHGNYDTIERERNKLLTLWIEE